MWLKRLSMLAFIQIMWSSGYSQANNDKDHIIFLNEVETLQEENGSLKKRIAALERAMENWSGNNLEQGKAVLIKNPPGSFKEPITVTYKMDARICESASILFFNMRGKEILSFQDLPCGFYSHRLESGSLKPGTYVCSLKIRNQIVDSQVILITK